MQPKFLICPLTGSQPNRTHQQNNSIINLMFVIKARDSPAVPKTKEFELIKNYIDVEGMQRIMNIKMPLLDYLYFD